MQIIDYEVFVKDVKRRMKYNECTKEYTQGAMDVLEIAKLFISELSTGWIPVKYRPLTVDERIAFARYTGIEYCDTVSEKAFDCLMPEDKQEILVSGSWGVSIDVAENDIDGEGFIYYGLEGNGDWEGIDAWMPLPEPYKETDDEC